MKINWLKNRLKNEEGSALLWTMMFVMIFFLIASTTTVISIIEARQSSKIDSSSEAYILAEAGAERARKYAEAGEETGGEKTGIIGAEGNREYIFEVVKASPGATTKYDKNLKDCTAGATNKYCYFSQATVGNIRRKIDGERSDISLNQGKTIDLYDTATTFNPVFGPSKLINMTPTNLPSSQNSFSYNVTIEKVTGSGGTTSRTGIIDMGGSSTNKKNINIFRTPTQVYLSLGYIDSTSGSYTNISGSSYLYKNIATSVNDIRANLTYKKGTNPSVILRLFDVENNTCLGVLVMSDTDDTRALGDISPYYSFFYGSDPTIIYSSGKVRTTKSTSPEIYYYYKNLYLRVE
ncbi:hypothetical protein C4544_00785 [candidate division WS5 bacterium]|uniref:Uncharacterized protein n=1 Tax=candidate division WS5 bacterium TaxID=2093353 RepID=A0A419DFW4_9BACT|nr:MAG: hypothetical protein C4544_00785 [candidate division WS5 bacterium]